jgi:PAS domain S-box-containing protein
MDEAKQTGGFRVGEAFARILTEATQSLVCVLDQGGRILFFNPACENATGFSRDEVIGRDARDFVIPPEEREAFGEVLAYVWKTGAPAPQVGHWLTKDGGRRLIAWSNKPMAGENGAPASLVTTIRSPATRRPSSRRSAASPPSSARSGAWPCSSPRR